VGASSKLFFEKSFVIYLTEVSSNATLMIIMLVQAVGQIPIVFLITTIKALFPRERYPVFFLVTSILCFSLATFGFFFFRETSGLTDKEKKNLYAKKTE
jgi:hypothetical protein